MCTKSAGHPADESAQSPNVFPLPVKLYLHGDLLFELYNGGRSWRRAARACAKLDARLYRSGDCVFEVRNGSQPRSLVVIEWVRLGFGVDQGTLSETNGLRAQSHVPRQKKARNSQQRSQLSLWPPYGQVLPND
jgi:hypothetical protein